MDKRKPYMREQRVRDAKDAARYRWWRARWTAPSEDDFDTLNDVLSSASTPGEVDAAIDAAIGGTATKPKGLPDYPLKPVAGCKWPGCDCPGRWDCSAATKGW